jgi:Ricin-type beta-trefoil lectin domain
VLKRVSRRAIAIPVALMGLTALMVVSVPSAASAQGEVLSTIVNRASGKCLSDGGSLANSAPITQYTCDGSNNQEFVVGGEGDTIRSYVGNLAGDYICLTNGGSTADSTPIAQYTCNGSTNQTWYFIAYDGYFVIENGDLAFCMTNGGSTKNSAPITQYACGFASHNQQWTVPGL